MNNRNFTRFTNALNEECKDKECDECGFYLDCIRCGMGFSANFSPERFIETVDRWCTENPVRTYLQDFSEKFPNAKIYESGVPCSVCRDTVYRGIYHDHCEKSCVDCWTEEMPEEENEVCTKETE